MAFFSPLPPETSGIADYSAELVPFLADHVELELFTGNPANTDSSLAGDFPLHAFADFVPRDRERPYDAVLYQIGNSAAHHGAIYRQLLERPGIVVLHEFMLHNLVRDLALAGSGRAEFVEAMRYSYGRTGVAMAGRLLHANNLPEMWQYPLFERTVDAAQSLIVHSRAARDRVLASRPTSRTHVVPQPLTLHGIGPLDRDARSGLLTAHGIAESAFVVGSFGHLTAAKHLKVSLEAFAAFRRTHPEAVYLLVGEVSKAYPELPAMLAGELGRGVVTTGRVTLESLLRYMALSDVAINLRHPTGGETSAACLRLLGLERPTLVSDSGWFSEIPDSCCVKISVGRDEAAEIAALLTALADDEVLRRQLSHNAARWAQGQHQPADVARAYAAVIATTCEESLRPYVPCPPLTSAPHDMMVTLVANVTAGMGDLGLTELDELPQRILAGILVDLDLTSPTSRV